MPPAHEDPDTVGDDAHTVLEKLDGEQKGSQVRGHVDVRGLDDFPVFVAVHCGPASVKQGTVGSVCA